MGCITPRWPLKTIQRLYYRVFLVERISTSLLLDNHIISASRNICTPWASSLVPGDGLGFIPASPSPVMPKSSGAEQKDAKLQPTLARKDRRPSRTCQAKGSQVLLPFGSVTLSLVELCKEAGSSFVLRPQVTQSKGQANLVGVL